MAKPYVIGIDMGGTNTVFGIVDARGNVIASSSIKTGKHSDFNDYIDELHTELSRLIEDNEADGKINGISFTELKETPGKGMLWEQAEYKDRFAGKDAKKLTLGADVDGITGVTITSKAVTNAVNAGVDFINAQIRGE